jgi:hypothetical protein
MPVKSQIVSKFIINYIKSLQKRTMHIIIHHKTVKSWQHLMIYWKCNYIQRLPLKSESTDLATKINSYRKKRTRGSCEFHHLPFLVCLR